MKLDARARSEIGRTVLGPAGHRVAAPATRKAHDRRRHPRLARELKTIRAMVWIYCHDLHGEDDAPCADCAELMHYAARRLDRCVFGDDKPTCAKCTMHCFDPVVRDRVRVALRYAGPRMLLRHPLLALAHIRAGRRPVPDHPAVPQGGLSASDR